MEVRNCCIARSNIIKKLENKKKELKKMEHNGSLYMLKMKYSKKVEIEVLQEFLDLTK